MHTEGPRGEDKNLLLKKEKSTIIQQVGKDHRLVPEVMGRAWTLHESSLH